VTAKKVKDAIVVMGLVIWLVIVQLINHRAIIVESLGTCLVSALRVVKTIGTLATIARRPGTLLVIVPRSDRKDVKSSRKVVS